MFKNQIPDFPNYARQGIPAAKPDLTNPVPEIYPVAGNGPQGWGLTFMLSNGGHTGRSKSAVHCESHVEAPLSLFLVLTNANATGAGLANCWWWCDPEHGVAGMIATQILPFADANVLKLWFDVEAETYVGLHAAETGK